MLRWTGQVSGGMQMDFATVPRPAGILSDHRGDGFEMTGPASIPD